MADSSDEMKQKSLISDLRQAMMEEHYYQARQLCGEVPDGPLQRITKYEDTVLHMAAQYKEKDLLLDLLKMVPEDRIHKLSQIKNTDGNTILHELATCSDMMDAATELLEKDFSLIMAPNNSGEMPIFCAARYGQTQMFELLADKMELRTLTPEESKPHLQRNDGTTVLHVSIVTECFDLALVIIKDYPYLIEERDQSSMTALQYLACNPVAFKREEMQIRQGFIGLLNKSDHVQGILGQLFSILCDFGRYFILTKLRLKNRWIGDYSFEDMKINDRDKLQDLVRALVKKDALWDVNINSQATILRGSKKEPKFEECSSKLSQKNSQECSTNKEKKSDESAFLLATMSNIQEIIEQVLNFQPEALQQTNTEGMNILHVAILYRHIDIFDMVIKHKMLSKRLLSATDDEGNSVLHMVSQKRKSQASEKMQSPALQLREELLLFEKVKSACKNLVTNPLNKDGKTAEELFAAANEQLHGEAKEWLMRTTENCTILSVFIATVSFAAVYTVPGGPNQDTGIPILHSKPFFLVFTLADVISLALALTSVGTFLSILTSSFPLQDFKMYLFKKLIQGTICMVLSVSMMAVAFGATIVLMMSHNREDVFWSVVAFLPVPIFFLSYSPLRSAALGHCRKWLKSFAVNFLMVVVILILVLLLLIYIVYAGLDWTVKKAYSFIICKPLSWVCGIESNAETGSTQPTAAPLTQV